MTSTTSSTSSSFNSNLHDLVNYTKPGVSRTALIKDEHTSFALICLTAGTQMPEHSTPRNVSVTVIEGRGILTLAGQEITLESGVFVYMPANTPHSLQAIANLAFLHT
jgi:quercetin dioxygenase-like cupin family protein